MGGDNTKKPEPLNVDVYLFACYTKNEYYSVKLKKRVDKGPRYVYIHDGFYVPDLDNAKDLRKIADWFLKAAEWVEKGPK